MEQRPDVSVVVPEELLQVARPARYVCLGIALLLACVLIVLFVKRRLRRSQG